MKVILAETGIAVAGAVRAGGDKARHALVIHRSKPLSVLMHELGKRSDNFYAEMIFKTLGSRHKSRGLTSAQGAEAVLNYLKAVGALEEGTVIRNGSGLYSSDQITTNTLTRVARAAYLDPRFSAEYVAQLAIGGVDGTLHGRFSAFKKSRVVRAKTGTLNDVTSLSGYVLAPVSGSPVAFSFVVNHIAGKVTGARAALDKCVSVIAHSVLKSNALPGPVPASESE